MAVPLPISNNINNWKTLLRRLARSFRHRAPTGAEIALLGPCFSAFVAMYPQFLYRLFPITNYPPGGYAYWCSKFAHVIGQVDTSVHGALLVALTNACNGFSASRYTT